MGTVEITDQEDCVQWAVKQVSKHFRVIYREDVLAGFDFFFAVLPVKRFLVRCLLLLVLASEALQVATVLPANRNNREKERGGAGGRGGCTHFMHSRSHMTIEGGGDCR